MKIPDRRALWRGAPFFLGWTGVALFFFSQDVTRNFLWHGVPGDRGVELGRHRRPAADSRSGEGDLEKGTQGTTGTAGTTEITGTGSLSLASGVPAVPVWLF